MMHATAVGVGIAALFLGLVLAVWIAAPRYGWLESRLWWWAYRRYLHSVRWRTLRRQVLRRDCRQCQDCGGVGHEVHHLRYFRWPWYALRLPEPRRNLICLCRACHEERHRKEE